MVGALDHTDVLKGSQPRLWGRGVGGALIGEMRKPGSNQDHVMLLKPQEEVVSRRSWATESGAAETSQKSRREGEA